MNDQSQMSFLPILQDSINATSLRVLPVGLWPFGSPDGQPINLCGLRVAPASHSASPEEEKAPVTEDTFSPNSEGSWKPVSLQSRLESRLRQRLDENGSPEYSMTWKKLDMKSREPICALRACPRRKSDKGYAGWPTATTRDGKGGYVGGRIRNGKISTDTLDVTVFLVAGWPAPGAMSPNALRGRGRDPEIRAAQGHQINLIDAVLLVLGTTQSGSSAGTTKLDASQVVLNPFFSAWLMGYPKEWILSGLRALASLSRRKSKAGLRSSKESETA